jgi:two-component system, NarL family, nitrate/nitrite response regulator NarL
VERVTQTILVGPHTLRREGIARALDSTDFRIVATGADLQKVDLGGLAKSIYLLIVECSHDVNGAIQQIQHFKAEFPDGKVVLFADHLSLEELLSAFRAGTNAYFVSVQTCEAFIKVLELVILGETVLPWELLRLIGKDRQEPPGGTCDLSNNGQGGGTEERQRGPRLSERERFILRRIIEGDSNKHVARRLNIAEATVKVHVKAILRKIDVRNRTQAAMWAMSKHGNDLLALQDDMAPPVSPTSEIAANCLQIGNGYKIDLVSHGVSPPTEISHSK